MAVRQHTLGTFLIIIRLLIDEEGLRRYHESIDWQKEAIASGEQM